MLDRLRCDAIDALRERTASPLLVTAAVLMLGAAIGMNLLLAVVLAATLIPARRASRVDSNALLRTDL